MAEEVEYQYKQEHITPFWQKLPFFFLFPLRMEPLLFMACIVGASAIAGLAFGGFGLVLKGFLVYLGLRYAINVLELFSTGRFEGESVDHTLWGPEKRPAKLSLLIVLFVVIGATLGNVLVTGRIAKNPQVQEQLIELYKKDHAVELAERERERAAFNARIGLTPDAPGSDQADSSDDATPTDSEQGAAGMADSTDAAQGASGTSASQADSGLVDGGLSREEIFSLYKPSASDPLWYKLLPAWYWVFMLLLSLMLPSAAIVIALEDKFFKSLNPAHIVFLLKSMGSAYFALWGLFLLIAGMRQLALTAGASWPPALRFPLEMGLVTYLALVLFAMMGYALYQFHQELSLDVSVDFDNHRKAGGAEAIAKAGSANAAMRAVESKDPLAHKVQTLLSEGRVDEAIAEVKDRMRYDRYDVDMNTRLHPLYVLKGDKELTTAHGQQWLTALVRGNLANQASDALGKLMLIDPEFTVQDGDAILPIVTAALKKREYEIVLKLVSGFDKRFPKHKDTAPVFFLTAKLASEYLRKHDRAVKILRILLTHFPEHDIVPEAKNYLNVLETILAQATPSTIGSAAN